jgi:phytoene desaturase
MASELERFSPGSAVGHGHFLRREGDRLAHLYPVLQQSWPNLASMASPLVAAAMPHVGLGQSLWATAGEYFTDAALQLAFSFQSAYLGMSPWECPGGFAMVPYVEHAWGVFHIQGGIQRLCETMARIAEENGARVRTGAAVTKLVVEGERCTGVLLDSGEQLACDEVVVNADGAEALNTLLDEPVSARFNRHHLEHLAESCSTFMLYLGLDRQLPLAHHTFFFAHDYLAEMDRVFRLGTVGADLSLYACNPSRTDPSLAPPGHASLTLLVLVPNTRAKVDWHLEGPHLRERALDVLEQRGELAVRQHIVAEKCFTPVDWEYQLGVSHGAVFGPAHSIDQLLGLRLPNQLPWPKNVMLAGGATSPGSGLPTILESARISTRLVCERNSLPFPPSRPLPLPAFELEG